MSEPAVVIRNLWAHFRLLEDRSGSLKEAVTRLRLARKRTTYWGLRDLNLEIQTGHTVGLIGANGSGKSTLLKCIAGIYAPTKGEVLVRGAVASLIELGADWHDELTGRENVMLNGALFGLSRKELRNKFDSIVEFAEIEDFIDQPIRTYSSGMYIRLAFSLAIHVEPDVLLIDEVLAVGDESFQRKCVEKVSDLHKRGATIVFVSHDLPLVKQLCSRTILLQEGRLVVDGDTSDAIERYLELEHIYSESPDV